MSKCEKAGCESFVTDRVWLSANPVRLCTVCCRLWSRYYGSDGRRLRLSVDYGACNARIDRFKNGGSTEIPILDLLVERESLTNEILDVFESWLAEPLEGSDG